MNGDRAMIKRMVGLMAGAIILSACLAATVTEAVAIKPIGLFATITCHHEEKEGDVTLLRQIWCDLRTVERYGDGRYDTIFNALDAWNGDEKKAMYERRKRMLAHVEEYGDKHSKYFNGYYDANNVRVNRADSLAVSFVTLPADYMGGAHGMHGVVGVNFDTATGKKLELHDVFSDAERTAAVVTERIFAQYGAEMLFDDPDKKILDAIVHETACWTLDNDGVTFYFNPYVLAPYASGVLSAKVYFDFDKSIFKEKYRAMPPAYATPIEETKPLSIDGQMSFVKVTMIEGKCRVHVGAEEVLTDGNRSDARGMFIHNGDGKNYVWVDIKNEDTGAREILVYALAPKLHYVGTLKRTFIDPASNEYEHRRLWMTNPDGFMIYKNVTLPGESKTDIGSVGENGLMVFG